MFKHARILILLAFLNALPAFCAIGYTNYATFMPTNNQGPWIGYCGVSNGIPNPNTTAHYNSYFSVFGVIADGVTDNHPALTNIPWSERAAGDGGSSNLTQEIRVHDDTPGVIYTSAGVQWPWHVGAATPWPKVRIVGDAGPHVDIISGPPDGPIITFNGVSAPASTIAADQLTITNNPQEGATNVLVNGGAGANYVGTPVLISETDDTNFVTVHQYDGGTCSTCGLAGTNNASQIVYVTSFQGTTNLGFTPPLVHTLANNPILQYRVQYMTASGIEGIQFKRAAPITNGTSYEVGFIYCNGCWMTNDAILNDTYQGLEIAGCFQCEFDRLYVYNAATTQTGKAYGVDFYGYAGLNNSFNALKNSAIDTQQFPVATESSGCANAILYCLLTNQIVGPSAAGQNSTTNFLTDAYNNHGAFEWFDLIEGCIIGKGSSDLAHGSSGFITYYRNYNSFGAYCYPETPGGVNQDAIIDYQPLYNAGWPGGWVTDNSVGSGFRAWSIDATNYFENIVGNIISTNFDLYQTTSGVSGIATNGPSTSITAHEPIAIAGLGYLQPSFTGVAADKLVGIRTFIHANWDPYNASVTYNSNPAFTTGLSNSLAYLNGTKPEFWDSRPFPPFNAATYTAATSIGDAIPAQDVWLEYNTPVVNTPILYAPAFH